MTCPSTGFIHALRVPPNLTSAREAIGWANWDIDPEEFSVQTWYNCGDGFLQVISYRGQGFPSSLAAKLLLFFAQNTSPLFAVGGITFIDRANLPNVGSNPRLRLALNFANCRPKSYWFCCRAKIEARTIVGRAASRLDPNITGSPSCGTIE